MEDNYITENQRKIIDVLIDYGQPMYEIANNIIVTKMSPLEIAKFSRLSSEVVDESLKSMPELLVQKCSFMDYEPFDIFTLYVVNVGAVSSVTCG